MKILGHVSVLALLFGLSVKNAVADRLGAPKSSIDERSLQVTTDELISTVGAAASSVEAAIYPAVDATDGSNRTRWSSARTDQQWLYVELFGSSNITQVVIFWEVAFASVYEIETSENARDWTFRVRIDNSTGGRDVINMPANTTGTFVRMKGIQRATRFGYSIYYMEVYGEPPMVDRGNSSDLPMITAVASSVERNTPHVATRSIDGTLATRWSSERTDDQWLYVELDANYPLHFVDIFWEVAFAAEYRLQVADDTPNNWRTVVTVTNGTGGNETLTLPPLTRGEFVRMLGDRRATRFGYSILDWKIRGDIDSPQPDEGITPIAPIAAVASSVEIQDSTLVASNTIDGREETRWASQRTDDQWIYVEVDRVRALRRVRLTWETAFGAAYEIQTSNTAAAGSWTTRVNVTNGQGGVEVWDLPAATTGKFVRMLGRRRGTRWGYSLFAFELFIPVVSVPDQPDPPTSVKLPITQVTASSIERAALNESNVADGDKTTRWASQRTDNQYIQVQFNQTYNLTLVELCWEAAFGLVYEIQVSNDGTNFNAVFTQTNGQGGNEVINLNSGIFGQYLRMQGVDRGTRWGYSLFGLDVFGFA